MSLRTRLIWAIALLAIILVGGTVAYMAIEGLQPLDAFYLAIITVSTVGFQEPAGGFSTAGEIATISLIITGVGTLFYTATTALEFTMEQFLGGTMQARRRRRRISRMRNHIIICGYGRVGHHVHDRLRRDNKQIVVIDNDADHARTAREAGLPVVEMDATDDRALEEAGIDHADALVASVRSDPDNVAIVLSARALQPDLRIVARANEPQAEKKLLLAGADRVVTPSVVGAERMALMVGHPDLADFIGLRLRGDDLMELRVEECRLEAGCTMDGTTLAESGIRERAGAMIIAVVPEGGQPVFNPPADFTLTHGQTLVAVGTPQQLSHLRDLLVSP